MSTLARFAGPLALIAGAVWVMAILLLVVAPQSYVWLALIAAMILIGAAALGIQHQAGARTGRLGRWGAVATAAGSVGILVSLAFALATAPLTSTTPPPPLVVAVSFASFFLWLIGGIGFALGLIRGHAMSAIAGWLIILGSAFGTALLAVGGQNPQPWLFLPMALNGVGWLLLGAEARTPVAQIPVAGHAA